MVSGCRSCNKMSSLVFQMFVSPNEWNCVYLGVVGSLITNRWTEALMVVLCLYLCWSRKL